MTKLGVVLPTRVAQWTDRGDAAKLVDVARQLEKLGYDSVWSNDTLLNPGVEALTLLAAIAPATDRITLGTAVLLPALRKPVQAAQTIASIDLLSGGDRLTLALGAGFPGRSEPEFAISDVRWRTRFTQLDETAALWRQLWSGQETTSYQGKTLHFDDLPPATPTATAGGPPLWLGGITPAALDRTARLYDGWLPYPPDPQTYADGWQTISRTGRNVTPALFLTILVDDDRERGLRTLDRYTRTNYGLPLEVVQTIQLLVTGSVEEIAAQLRPYLAAGADHLVIRVGALDLAGQRDQLEAIASLRELL